MARTNSGRIVRLFVFTFVVLYLTAAQSRAQVTFSRDWSAGKRAVMDNPDLRSSLKSATTVCHLLVNQIRQLANCEATRNEDMDNPQIFSGKR